MKLWHILGLLLLGGLTAIIVRSVDKNATPPDVATPGMTVKAAEAPLTAQDAPTLELLTSPATTLSSDEARAADAIVQVFKTGDFGKALAMAEKSYAADSSSPALRAWITAQMPVLLASAGWKMLNAGDCDSAVELLQRAASFKRSKETAKGLAYCYARLGIHSLALDEFAWYLENSPTDADMLLLYSDSLESEGRLQEAADALASLLQLPEEQLRGHEALEDRAALTKRLTGMREKAREAPRQSREASTNFLIAYRFDRHEAIIAFVMKTLEDALDEYTNEFGFRPPSSPIEVVLYQADYFRRVVPGGPLWAEGIFDGRLRIPVGDEKNGLRDNSILRRVLRHELVHALAAIMADRHPLPSWFAEGMAQRLECVGEAMCASFAFPPTPGGFLAADKLESPFTALDSMLAARAYSQSLYLVHVIERTLGGQDALRDMIRNITPAAILKSNDLLAGLTIDFETLHRRASGYWARRTPPERMGAGD